MKSMKELKYTISESNESGNDSNSVTPMSDFSSNSKQQKMIKQLDISKFSVVKPNTKNELIEIDSDDEDNEKIEIKIKPSKSSNSTPKIRNNSSKRENIVNIDDDPTTEEDENEQEDKENRNVTNIKKEDPIKVKRKNSPIPDETFVVTKLLRTTPNFIPDSSPLTTILKETNQHLTNTFKICPECSNNNRSVARFCDNCGHKF